VFRAIATLHSSRCLCRDFERQDSLLTDDPVDTRLKFTPTREHRLARYSLRRGRRTSLVLSASESKSVIPDAITSFPKCHLLFLLGSAHYSFPQSFDDEFRQSRFVVYGVVLGGPYQILRQSNRRRSQLLSYTGVRQWDCGGLG
jgi:hypothetical protein